MSKNVQMAGHKNFNQLLNKVQDISGIDMVNTKDTGKLTHHQEQEMRAAMTSNQNTMRNNADIYAENCPEYFTCHQYQPCPICNKCKNKASNLYVACQNCQIPICGHKQSDIERMIKRSNFKMKMTGSDLGAQIESEVERRGKV